MFGSCLGVESERDRGNLEPVIMVLGGLGKTTQTQRLSIESKDLNSSKREYMLQHFANPEVPHKCKLLSFGLAAYYQLNTQGRKIQDTINVINVNDTVP